MKKIFINIALWIALASYSQTVPQAFNYQGIARDLQGTSLGSKTLGIRITLQEKSGNTTTDVYAETHTVTTNAYGLFNIAIGRGNATIGSFAGVNFSGKNISVKTEIDPNGSSNYTIAGNSELLSVPYALVAGTGSESHWNKNTTTNDVYVNNGEKVGIGTNSPSQSLHVESNQTSSGREMIRVKNTNSNSDCNASLGIVAGNVAEGLVLTQYANNYTLIPKYEGMSSLMAYGNGLILNTRNPNAFISFMTQNSGFEYEKMRLSADGKLGIGTSTPTATLDLVGSARLRNIEASTTNTSLLTADASGNLAFRDLSTIPTLSSPWTKNSTDNTVTVSNGEKVGIGTSNPEWLLHLSQFGTGADRNMVMVNNTNNGTDATVGLTLKVGTASDDILAFGYNGPNYNILPNVQSRGGMLSKNIDIKAQSSTGNIKFYTGGQIGGTSSTERMSINADGNIGIGTATPTATLDLAGSARLRSIASSTTNTRLLTADASGNLAFRDLSTISALSSPWTKNNTDNTVTVSKGEKVGIGIANPTQMLHIQSNETGSGRALVFIKNTNPNNDCLAVMHLSAGGPDILDGGATISLTQYAKSYTLIPNYSGMSSLMSYGNGLILNTREPAAFISFMTQGSGFEYEKMRLTADGNLGIGTSDAKAKLQVSQGDIYLDDATKGVIMTSPNGQCWRVTVSNTGAIVSTAITCP